MGVACTLNGPGLPIDPCGSVRQESASERFGRGDYVQVPHLEIRVPMAHAFLGERSLGRRRCADRCASQPQLALDRGACEKTTVRGSLWPARGFPSI